MHSARQDPARSATAYALLDGNNFYVACERLFDPRLQRRPVVVLSNNDGCAIARSEEAKALGIRMGAPWFQIEHLEREAGLVALSANFALYGDLSDRMMSLAARLGSRQQVYSIDECFLELTGLTDASARARDTRAQILQWLDLPTCIGIAPTKTLAKLANHIAKSAERKPGSYPAQLAQVCNLMELSARQRDWLYRRTPAGEVWGIGPRLARQLGEAGIQTVQDLARLDPVTARQRWSVVLERTVRELNGQPCFSLEDAPPPRQQIAVTRSFGQRVTGLRELQEAVSHFAASAARKLREQNGLANQVMVFIRTSPFRTQQAQYSRSITLPLRRPCADTLVISATALAGLERIYRQGYDYARAGVMLLDLQPDRLLQQELDLDGASGADRQQRLMRAIDAINQRHGAGSLRTASMLVAGSTQAPRSWTMRQQRRSPRYTSCWDELAQVRA